MPKPPKATHHSDIEGVHRDERRHVDVAVDAGQDGYDLAQAKQQSRGRPPQSDPTEGDAED